MGLLGRLLFAAVLGVSLCANAAGAKSDSIPPETARLLPEQIGTFKAIDVAAAMPDYSPKLFSEGSFRTYAMDGGGRYTVNIRQTANDAEAFAWLTQARSYFKQSGHDWKLSFDDTGSASFMGDRSVFFYKGNTVVSVTAANDGTAAQTKELANQLAAQLDGGEGEIPVLVKHLPNWETAGKSAIYAVSLDDLKQAVPMSGQSQPVLDVLTFDGGTEAVTANYGPSQLVIVEFTTPQFSIDNDSRIWTKIAELKSQGQPTPTAYRRVGNYSVFVFNGPDEKTANALVEQVKYEQVVQWLGDDPHLYERLQRYFTQTSAGVLVAVLKSSGLSLILCLAVGSLIGALLFRHRRAQRAAAFSDAGGSIRLNLDELTGAASSRRLLSTSEDTRKDPAS